MSNPPSLTPAQLNYADTAMWKEILRQSLADLRVSIPAIVESVDYSKNPPVVTAQIAIKELVKMPSGPQWTDIYPISNVPIALFSAGGFSLTLPVAEGDEGLLVFTDMCFDLWWTRGGVQEQFERRRHDVADCIFIPGPRSQARPISSWSQNSAQLRTDDGTCYLELAPGGVINLVAPGGINLNGAVLAQKTLEVQELFTADDGMDVTGTVNAEGGTLELNGALTASGEVTGNGIPLSTHVHGGVQTGGSDSGPPIP